MPTAKRERLPPHPPHPLAVPLLDKKKVPTKSVCAGRQGKTREGEKERRREGEKERRREGEKERRREGEKEREFIDSFHRALVEP